MLVKRLRLIKANRATATNLCLARVYGTEQQPPTVEEETVKTRKGLATTVELEWLTRELNVARRETAELLYSYKRALVDGENMRNRLNTQIDDARICGIRGFCKDLIEVADVLGQATEAVPKDRLNTNPDVQCLYEGLRLTRALLLQVFKRHGLKTLDPINQKFDPNLHEARFQTVDATVEANTVVQVTKLGYELHKCCIRPAVVGVSKRE